MGESFKPQTMIPLPIILLVSILILCFLGAFAVFVSQVIFALYLVISGQADSYLKYLEEKRIEAIKEKDNLL